MNTGSQKELFSALKLIRRFAPKELPKPVVEATCTELITCYRIGMVINTHLDTERGHHLITVCIFPEAIPLSSMPIRKYWDGIMHSTTIRVEKLESAVPIRLKMHIDKRRTAIAYSRWAIEVEAKPVRVASVTLAVGELAREERSTEDGGNEGGDEQPTPELKTLAALPAIDPADLN